MPKYAILLSEANAKCNSLCSHCKFRLPIQSSIMYSDDGLLIVAVIIVGQNDQAKESRERLCWVGLNLKSDRAKYSVNDLISGEIEKLNLDYRCESGF